MSPVLTGILVVLLAVMALLAIPVTVLFRLSWPDVKENDVRLHWVFGLMRVRLLSEPSAPGGLPADSGTAQEKRPTRSPGDKAKVWAAIRQTRFRRRVLRFVGDVWTAIRKHDMRLRMRIGLGDPADTGRLWAAVGPVSGMLASVRSVAIEVEPEFNDETLELLGRGRIRIVPLELLYLAVGLCLSPSIWRGVRAMRTSAG